MKLSVIIVNYNTKELTLKLLASIFRSTATRDFEIIVIDNASTDDSANALRSAYPQIALYRSDRNLGFAAGVNRGIKQSRGEFILILNPDIELKEHSIDRMLGFMDEQRGAGAVGCKILNPDGSVQPSGKSFPSPPVFLFVTFNLHKLFPNNPVTSGYYHPAQSYDLTHQVEHLMASCLMLRRSAVEKAGLMDENFFLYCEDVDWCYRIHKAGYEIWYLAEAEVYHQKGGATRKESYRGIIEYHKSAWYFYKKYYYDRYPRVLSCLFYWGLQARKLFFLIQNWISREKQVKY